MINNYYSEQTYNELKKRNLKFLILSIGLFVFGVAFLLLSAFLINTSTVTWVKAIDIVVLSVSLVLSAFFFLEGYIPGNARKKFIYRLLTVERFKGTLKIIKIRKPYLIKKNIHAYEIEANDEEGKTMICYYETVNPLTFKANDQINVVLAMNFIVEIEENSHESQD